MFAALAEDEPCECEAQAALAEDEDCEAQVHEEEVHEAKLRDELVRRLKEPSHSIVQHESQSIREALVHMMILRLQSNIHSQHQKPVVVRAGFHQLNGTSDVYVLRVTKQSYICEAPRTGASQ